MDNIDSILEYIDCWEVTEEVDFGKTVRVYGNSILPEKDLKDPEEMKEHLANIEYIYYIPAHNDEGIYEGDYYFQIEKGRGPSEECLRENILTEKQIKSLEDKKGKWNVVVTKVKEPEDTGWDIIDYWERMTTFLDCMGITESETFFLGGMSTISHTIGVCYTEDSDSPYYVAVEKINPDAKTAADVQDCIYTYDEISESTWEKYCETTDPNLDGIGTEVSTKAGDMSFLICVIVAVVIVGVVVFVVSRRKMKKS